MRTCVLRGPDLVTRLESVIRIGERSPKLVPMPSVMRYPTRSKDSERVRVLRSGRTVSMEAKVAVSEKESYMNKPTQDLWANGIVIDEVCPKNRFGIVYARKRKRASVNSDSRRYGLQFKRKKTGLKKKAPLDKRVLYIGSAFSLDMSTVVNSILTYMWTAKAGLLEVSCFLQSELFVSHGISFSLNDSCNIPHRLCKIYGAGEFNPLFDIDFSCIPICFMHMHATMWFKSLRASLILINAADRTGEVSELGNTLYWSSQRKRKRSVRKRRADFRSLSLESRIRKSTVRVLTNHKTRQSFHKNFSNKEMDTVSCGVNLLVIEPHRCYRESGACVTLESSTSHEWILAIRMGGSLRYHHKVPKGKEIKPSCTNRFTYAIIWYVEAQWKLEFTERREWAKFKELFRICGDRNVDLPSPATAIPIPGVFEGSVCDTPSPATPYVRSESYIKMHGDELTRALFRCTANYDMDSEDEEWLNKFNSKLDSDSFELIFDIFEKAAFRQAGDFDGIKATVGDCLDLASTEVVEAMYNYWIMKRKRKRGPLLRVFKQHPQIPVISTPVSRKKRKQQQRQSHGRGKTFSVLKAIAAKQNANEEKTAMLRVEQATAAATTALNVALGKRTRAQILLEKADLAVYRATKALRIAEAASFS